MVWFSGRGSIKSKIGLSNLEGLLQPQWFCGSNQLKPAFTGLPEAGTEHSGVINSRREKIKMHLSS